MKMRQLVAYDALFLILLARDVEGNTVLDCAESLIAHVSSRLKTFKKLWLRVVNVASYGRRYAWRRSDYLLETIVAVSKRGAAFLAKLVKTRAFHFTRSAADG